MHPFQHVVSGDSAADSLRTALDLGPADLVNMRDDLSLGPLGDVDAAESPQRAAFWRKIYGPQAAAFEDRWGPFAAGLAETAKRFRHLPDDPRPCLVWFGNGANEQLTLRRTASFLDGNAREIWAAEVLPSDHAPLPPFWVTGVGVLRSDELPRVYERRRLLGAAERSALAEGWRRVRVESSDDTLRHYTAGQIETRPIDSFDARILRATRSDWTVTARVVGDAMAGCWDGSEEDALISDAFIFWRLRGLAKQGKVEIDRPDSGMRESKVRRPGANVPT